MNSDIVLTIDRQDFRYEMISKIPKIKNVRSIYYVNLHKFTLVHINEISEYHPYSKKVVDSNLFSYAIGRCAFSN